MKFRTFKQNKLVRDKIVHLMESNGSKLYSYKLNDQDFAKQLKLKLVEEALEISHTKNMAELTEELADIIEVTNSLAKLYNITDEELKAAQEKKALEKGSFNERIFVTFAEHPKDSPQERYCLSDPEKYPEVKSF